MRHYFKRTRCPTLSELPDPPAGRSGWPWTQGGSHQSGGETDIRVWPKISIVTPSFNQGIFVEETIRSVLLQGYPNLEYIVIDGGSTDDSVEIIRKYEKWLSFWVSEHDAGQADAVNKGWILSNSSILGWLNSDDTYSDSTLIRVANTFTNDQAILMVYGDCAEIDQCGNHLNTKSMESYNLEQLVKGKQMGQPAVFVASSAASEVGYLDTKKQWALDTDFFLRFWVRYPIEATAHISDVLANSRVYETTKSNTGVHRIAIERRETLDDLFESGQFDYRLRHLRRKAYASTYWNQANRELSAGYRFRAMGSLIRMLLFSPTFLSPIEILRLLGSISLPAHMRRLMRNVMANSANSSKNT